MMRQTFGRPASQVGAWLGGVGCAGGEAGISSCASYRWQPAVDPPCLHVFFGGPTALDLWQQI